MSDHLTSALLNSLADGELSADQLTLANRHLADCLHCTSTALAQSLLKSATTRAGQRYTPPEHLRERLAHISAQEASPSLQKSPALERPARNFSSWGWAAALAAVLLSVTLFLTQRNTQQASANAALTAEVADLHIATLAANAPPEVLSSDRHTVKPWFQGKIPFSFNLPANLPADTTLDGANLTYLRNQPTAQLLFSIGKHRVSVFVQQTTSPPLPTRLLADHSGFHVAEFRTGDLDAVAISDVDPARLASLAHQIAQAQPQTAQPQAATQAQPD
jgi:anti-sigma factor RsiW